MIRIERISTFANQGTGRAQTVFRTVAAQPSWITRLALTVFLIVIGLPIVLLVLLAVFAAVVVFSLLAMFNALIMWARGALPARADGRENVRIIRRT